MARVSKLWRLNIYCEPTEAAVPVEHVKEALYALQAEALAPRAEQIAASPLGPVLVALVKHMARASGSYVAVELDGPSLLDDAEQMRASGRDGLEGV